LNDVFSLRIGRQIVAWGDSDYARMIDVINPRDLTQPGLIDLEDARLPAAAFRLSGQWDEWSFEAVTIHEHQGSRLSGKGSDFDYYARLRYPTVFINDKDTPSKGFEDTGFALKITRAFNGGDISVVLADTFDHVPYLRYDGLSSGFMRFTPEYKRLKTYGISATFVKGSGLFKFESAFQQDRKMMRNDFLTQIGSGIPTASVRTAADVNQAHVLSGIEYTGFDNFRLCFEAQMIHTFDHQNNLSDAEDEFITYFQATKELYNETLELDLFWVYMNPGDGNILRLSATYDILDGLSVQAGLAFYMSQKETADLYPYKDQDRVFIRIKYSF
jgi:hypothetical protein